MTHPGSISALDLLVGTRQPPSIVRERLLRGDRNQCERLLNERRVPIRKGQERTAKFDCPSLWIREGVEVRDEITEIDTLMQGRK